MRLNHPAFQNQRLFRYQTGGGATDLRRWIIAESYVADSSVVIVGNFDVVANNFTIPNIPMNGIWRNMFGAQHFGIGPVLVTNNTMNVTLPPGAYIIFTREWHDNVSIADLDRTENAMTVHPNPAQDEIFVEFETEAQREIMIHNPSGQLVQTATTRDQHIRIDVSHLRGLHILTVNDGTRVSSQQIIIQ